MKFRIQFKRGVVLLNLSKVIIVGNGALGLASVLVYPLISSSFVSSCDFVCYVFSEQTICTLRVGEFVM